MIQVDWSEAYKEATHALVRGRDAKRSCIFGDVIFVIYDHPNFWLKDVGAVDIGDDAWVVKEERPEDK